MEARDKLYGFNRPKIGDHRHQLPPHRPRNIKSEEDFQEIMQQEFEHEKTLLKSTGEKGISDQYIILDSFRKNPESRVDKGEFIFNLAIQGSTTESTIGVRDKMDNVIEIQIGAFYLPPMPLISYGISDDLVNVGTDPQYPQFFPGQDITMYVREAGLQSYSDLNGRRHTFDLRVRNTIIPVNNPVSTSADAFSSALAEPYYNGWDTYRFTDPIMDLSTITLQFNTPDAQLAFYQDTFYVNTVAGGTFQIVDKPLYDALTMLYYANANIHRRILISGYTSESATANAIINNPYGVGIELTPTDTITILPTIAFAHIQPACRIKVQILQNRVRIPLRVRRLIDRRTNSIIPTSS